MDRSAKAGNHLLERDRLRRHRAGIPVKNGASCKALDYNQSRQCASSDGISPGYRLRPQGPNAFIGQLVGALVLSMPRMPPHPVPTDAVRACEPIQLQPQVDILDRLFSGGLPAAALPRRDPLADPLL